MEAYNIAKTPSKYANVNISCQMLICVACKIARLRLCSNKNQCIYTSGKGWFQCFKII